MLAASQTVIPDTAPGKLLKGWIDTFNAGDVDARAKFIREHYSDAVLDGAPPERMARRGLEFREEAGGGLDLYKIAQSSETEIKALLKERGGFGWAVIGIKVDPAKPNMVIAVDIDQAPTPSEESSPTRRAGCVSQRC